MRFLPIRIFAKLFLVDVSSIDRRDTEREYQSIERVDSLVKAFMNSAIHRQTMENIDKAVRQSPSPYLSMESDNEGPHIFRVMITLIGYL